MAKHQVRLPGASGGYNFPSRIGAMKFASGLACVFNRTPASPAEIEVDGQRWSVCDLLAYRHLYL